MPQLELSVIKSMGAILVRFSPPLYNNRFVTINLKVYPLFYTSMSAGVWTQVSLIFWMGSYSIEVQGEERAVTSAF